ncbi:MAG: type IV pilus twitching motility protein PilT [Gammaproteobacteria bacterium]|nr:type IV pilus twitching motility protein PilT [Gammaproteobacteria bacterium]NNL00105.1 type IV pilus twitching motility protein PilT [Xanthomonadales bacterium]
MTPPVHATADLAEIESASSSTQSPAAKPQVRLVKIDGKLTAVPVQVEEPLQVKEPVQAAKLVGIVAPERNFETIHVVEPEPAAESKPAEKSAVLTYNANVTIQNLLQQALELNASDLHVHSGAFLRIRINGKFLEATPTVMSSQECERLIMDILSESQLRQLKEKFQVDFAYQIDGVGRFRVNVYKQQRGYDAVFRIIKLTPPTLVDLGLPKEFEKYTEFHQGLMLFTGPAGCGKSSTMAAMADLINKRRPDHILTIEDPIEYVHASKSCNVTQREVGIQTESFPTALRAALREDPDVIVIGELRDLETISLAITAAETGHLVMATLHTSNAIRTINRLLSVFPPDQICQIRRMLSESLKVVISQRLVKRADDRGLVAALEVMINNNAVGNLIRENRTFQIKSILQTGRAQGQRLLDASLTQLVKERVITKKEAIKHAEEPENFN